MPLRRFQALLDHYLTLDKAPAGAPRRADFRPEALKPLLPWLMILRRNAEDQFAITLAGSAVEQTLGITFDAQTISSDSQLAQNSALKSFLRKMLDTPCAGMLRMDIEAREKVHGDINCLFLPLADRSGEHIDRLLVANVIDRPSDYMPFADLVSKDALHLRSITDLRYVALDQLSGLHPHSLINAWPDSLCP